MWRQPAQPQRGGAGGTAAAAAGNGKLPPRELFEGGIMCGHLYDYVGEAATWVEAPCKEANRVETVNEARMVSPCGSAGLAGMMCSSAAMLQGRPASSPYSGAPAWSGYVAGNSSNYQT